MEKNLTNNQQLSHMELIKLVFTRVALAIPVLLAIFFLPAGTWAYWEAWIYLAVLFIPMSLVLVYLLKNDPKLLERRMRVRERESAQKRIIAFTLVYYLIAFMLPGFDRRWEWSQVPVAVVVVADVLVLIGYGIFFLVLIENSYASRVVEVEKTQQVIQSGPYAIVRHPMYLGIMVMYVASPLALGSYWAIIPAAMIVPILVMRIINEEKVLTGELPGYAEYTQKVRYRLIPAIW